jgi:putative ABC transport system permease protein
MASNFLPLEPNRASSLSLPTLAFTIALSILTGIAMGIYPALQSSRTDLAGSLKEGGRGMSGSARQQRFRNLLVGAQVALSVTLLAGALLLISSFIRLSHQKTGFRSDDLWVGFITFPAARYPDLGSRARFAEQTRAALQNVPGIESVAISGDIPLTGSNRTLYARADRDVPAVPQRAAAPSHDVAPGYFHTWRIPVLAGRDFDQHDAEDRQNVVIISRNGAKKLFGDEDPIGKTLLVTSGSVPCEIVGIVGDVRSERLNIIHDMEFYRPWTQENFPFMAIAVRSKLPLAAITKLVQSSINRIDAGIAIAQPQMMDTIVAQALGQARLMMWLLGIFAGVALLLATVGIYGAVAYTVEQRTGEIGVRMALGAQTASILRLIVRQGMKPVVIGLMIGFATALAVGRLIASQLYQTSAYDPLLLGATLSILAMAALLACLFPAHRATLVNPVEALRAE